MVQQRIIYIDKCPKCGQIHEKLPVQDEKTVIFRGDDSKGLEVVVICPIRNERFKVTLKENKR